MTELATMINMKKQWDLLDKKVRLIDEGFKRFHEGKQITDICDQIEEINKELQMLREEK